MLRDADALLVKARAVIPDAAGLRAVRRPGPRARERGAAADDRGREAGGRGQRRARRTRADRALRARRRRRGTLAGGGQHGQRGRRRPAARGRGLRDRQAHRPLLPPGRRPRRPAAPGGPRRPRRHRLPARRSGADRMCRARRGRAAPAGQRRDRCGVRGRAAAGAGAPKRLPAARRPGRSPAA